MARKYNPKKVVVTWRGIPLAGFMDGTFVTVEADEDSTMKHVGADGRATVALNANQGAQITVTLAQSSPANDLLSAMLPNADSDSLPTGDFMIKDLNGTTLCHADVAWLKRPANVSYGKEIEGREWTFDCEAMVFLVGGSAGV
jgi:hypothetical protein